MSERSGTTIREYIVLELLRDENGDATDAYKLRGQARARGPRGAISHIVAKEELGTFYAVPLKLWRAQHLGIRPARIWVGG